VSGLLGRFRAGDRGALARLLTHVENQTDIGRRALAELGGQGGDARIIGVTGPPGAGKSTLVNRLVSALRQRGDTVAVLAVDPTSPLTGGATLGDRIRMLEQGADSGVYVRSMASRGQLGGLALATFSAVQLLDAFGFDTILIETVGVGQDEVDIAMLADTVLLLQVPGLGDAVQSIKAGVLEIADVVAVNKAELPGARELMRDLRLVLRDQGARDWAVPIVPVTALDGSGIDALLEEMDRHWLHQQRSRTGQRRALDRTRFFARLLALNELDRWISKRHDSDERAATVELSDPMALARRLIEEFAAAKRSQPG
jgi:LAO/AO transport system kinase